MIVAKRLRVLRNLDEMFQWRNFVSRLKGKAFIIFPPAPTDLDLVQDSESKVYHLLMFLLLLMFLKFFIII